MCNGLLVLAGDFGGEKNGLPPAILTSTPESSQLLSPIAHGGPRGRNTGDGQRRGGEIDASVKLNRPRSNWRQIPRRGTKRLAITSVGFGGATKTTSLISSFSLNRWFVKLVGGWGTFFTRNADTPAPFIVLKLNSTFAFCRSKRPNVRCLPRRLSLPQAIRTLSFARKFFPSLVCWVANSAVWGRGVVSTT